MKKSTILILGLTLMMGSYVKAQVKLSSAVKATYHESIREKVSNFYQNALGAEIVSQPNGISNLDAISFNNGTKLNVIYTSDKKKVLSEKQAYNSLWIQLETTNFESLTSRIRATGVKLIPEYTKEDKFYFQAPGGQVIRLVKTQEERDGTLTKEEIAFAVKHLQNSRDQLWNQIKNLTETQWNFKSDTGKWSISQIAEHISKAEELVIEKQVAKALMSPAEPERLVSAASNTEHVLAFIIDRSRKFPAAPGTVPESKWKSPKEFMEYYDTQRNKTIEFISKSDIPLRTHLTKKNNALGDMDAYNWLVFISGHTLRHIEQIKEVKGDNQYASL